MIEFGQRVKVYRNLRTGNFSVVDPKTGRVIDRLDSFYMMDCDFRVQPGGQKRAQDSGQRNVHAYVMGDFCGRTKIDLETYNVKEVHYNPFNDTWFNDGESVVTYGNMVIFQDGKAYIAK